MAEVIDRFLIGLGFDVDEQGADAAQGSIDGLRSSALQLGALVGTGLGLRALTTDFANSANEAGNFAENIGIAVEDIDRLGFAIAREGGSIQELRGELTALDQFVAGLQIGDPGFLAAAETAGIQTEAIINAGNAFEAYLAIADQFQGLTRQQRVNAAQALGFGPASVRLLSRGRQGIEDYLAEADRYGTLTQESTEVAKEFNDSLTNTGRIFTNLGNTISTSFLPFLTDANNELNEFLSNNRDLIETGIRSVAEEAPGTVVAATAAGATVLAGQALSAAGNVGARVGLLNPAANAAVGRVAAGSRALGSVGLAGAGGFAAGTVLNETTIRGTFIGDIIQSAVATTLAAFGNEEARRSIATLARNEAIVRQAGGLTGTTINFNPVQSDIPTIRNVVRGELSLASTQAQQDLLSADEG